MLVHICCSVDSHYFLSELQKAYPSENLIGFFYNPNIHPKSEHDLRLKDVRRSCEMLGVKLIEGRYDTSEWLKGVRGLEEAPEKGERCVKCFDIRLERSAEVASEIGEVRFTSTLLASPMKEQEVLYQQGDIIAKAHKLDFVKINVRANGGVNKQNALAKKDNLYRQNYCGCKYALEKQRKKQERYSLEMMSDIGGRALPASIEDRSEVFVKRDALEKAGKKYILTQRKKRIYRVLSHRLSLNEVAIPNYVLAHSESKRIKMELPTWVEIYVNVHNPPFLRHFYESLRVDSKADFAPNKANPSPHSAETMLATKIMIGIVQRDDAVFLPLKSFNKIICTRQKCENNGNNKDRVSHNDDMRYSSVKELIYAPICYEEEIYLRALLCGYESINPVIIIDDEVAKDLAESQNLANNAKPTSNPLMLSVESFFQDEKVFEVVEIV